MSKTEGPLFGRMHVVCDKCNKINWYYPQDYGEDKEGPDECAYCGAELIYGG